jgi:hypothetical protein
VLVEMEDTPSEAWESTGSVELANVNWASANHPTPEVGTKTNDDHLNQDDHNRPAVDSTLNGPIGVGLGVAATISGNVLFSPSPTQALETQVAWLQASLAQAIQEKAQEIQEKDQMIRQVIQEKERAIQEKDRMIRQVLQEKEQVIHQLAAKDAVLTMKEATLTSKDQVIHELREKMDDLQHYSM